MSKILKDAHRALDAILEIYDKNTAPVRAQKRVIRNLQEQEAKCAA